MKEEGGGGMGERRGWGGGGGGGGGGRGRFRRLKGAAVWHTLLQITSHCQGTSREYIINTGV